MTGPGASAQASRARRLRAPAVSAVAGGLLAAALVVNDPYHEGSWGFCPVYVATGFYCATCGALRGTADALHRDLAAAWAMNPLWMLAAPAVAWWWIVWVVRRWRGRPGPAMPVWAAWAVMALLVVFSVVRNLPGLELLAPH